MQLLDVSITSKEERAEGLFVLSFESKEIAQSIRPGQFLNIRVDTTTSPLLRRPFSVSRVDGNIVEIIFNIVGRGTELLAAKKPGDQLNILGPLGIPFGSGDAFESAVLVAGGLGVAPFPLLTSELTSQGKSISTFLGSRSASHLSAEHLVNVHVATDDGSQGFHGTVVDLLETEWGSLPSPGVKIFGCGPTPMLKALSRFARSKDAVCELSLEGDMACGIGICQGCPVERVSGPKRYALVCVEGPTFNCKDIILA